MQSYKGTPNIFYASSSKSKNRSCILSIFKNNQAFVEALKDIPFQNDEVPVKIPSFQKFTLFSTILNIP